MKYFNFPQNGRHSFGGVLFILVNNDLLSFCADIMMNNENHPFKICLKKFNFCSFLKKRSFVAFCAALQLLLVKHEFERIIMLLLQLKIVFFFSSI